jgi:CBS-domain-containing membrane protein
MLKTIGRLLWISIGATAGLGLALYLTQSSESPLMLASLGGSTFFLFGLTGAPAAQPRALFGGHFISALVGIICYQLFGDSLWVYLAAEVIALSTLLLTQTIHPPAGANPLIMIHTHAGFIHLVAVVLLGVAALAIVAAVWSRLTPGRGIHYPVRWNEPSPPSRNWSVWS